MELVGREQGGATGDIRGESDRVPDVERDCDCDDLETDEERETDDGGWLIGGGKSSQPPPTHGASQFLYDRDRKLTNHFGAS